MGSPGSFVIESSRFYYSFERSGVSFASDARDENKKTLKFDRQNDKEREVIKRRTRGKTKSVTNPRNFETWMYPSVGILN